MTFAPPPASKVTNPDAIIGTENTSVRMGVHSYCGRGNRSLFYKRSAIYAVLLSVVHDISSSSTQYIRPSGASFLHRSKPTGNHYLQWFGRINFKRGQESD